MAIPITPYGRPQVVVFSLVMLVLTGLCVLLLPPVWNAAGGGLFGAVLIWVLWFFRDPPRTIPQTDRVFVSPADGRVTDITEVQDCEFLNEPALRVGIFLSVFDVHINRAPAAGRVAWIEYRPGQFLNALRAESSARNEANLVGLEIDGGRMRMLVKQIAGVIARRIVCPVKPGDTLQRGQRFGMIKFGSRTEVYVPQRCVERIDVKIGQHIRAGSTVVGVLR